MKIPWSSAHQQHSSQGLPMPVGWGGPPCPATQFGFIWDLSSWWKWVSWVGRASLPCKEIRVKVTFIIFGNEFNGWGGPPCHVKKLGFRWFLSFWWQWVWLENIQRWFIILVAMKFWPPVQAEHWEWGDHSPRQADHFDQGLNPPGDDSDHKLMMMILIMIMIIMIMILPKQIRLTKSGPTT